MHLPLPDGFRPMLAETVKDLGRLRFPLYGSPKIDGVRCITAGGRVLSRSLKPIRNAHVRRLLAQHQGYDGELVLGDEAAPDVYLRTQSAVNSIDGEPDVRLLAFDHVGGHNFQLATFDERLQLLRQSLPGGARGPVRMLEQVMLGSRAELDEYVAWNLFLGYEGTMVRCPVAPYKFNRSTLREGYLLKIKPFADAEAMVVGFEELLHNANEAETDERGFTVRSSHQGNMVPMGTLGALVVTCAPFPGREFRIGSGFTAAQRQEVWDNRPAWLGRAVVFKYQVVGTKDVPRLPIYKGPREAWDG